MTTYKNLAICLVAAVSLGACSTQQATTTGPEFAVGYSAPENWVRPDPSELHRGKIQFDAGHYGLAEEHFRRHVERYSASLEGWIGLAASYDQLGRFDLADRAYREATEVGGRRADILNNQGYSHYLRGDFATARKLFHEAQALSPEDPRIAANIALVSS